MKLAVEIEVPEPIEVNLDPAKTAIVVIDMENEFCAPGGKKFIGSPAQEAVRAVAALIKRGRQAGVSVLWVRSVREPDALEFTAFKQGAHLIDGTWAVEYTSPLQVLDREPVFKKHCHDCFTHTGLEQHLTNHHMTAPDWTMIVVGVALHVCVNHAVLGFSVRHYRTVLPLDCIAPRTGVGAAATLWRYGQPAYAYNITVSSSERIRFEAPAN